MPAVSKPSLPTSLVAAAVICVLGTVGVVQAQPLLDPLSLTKFVDPLPNPLANVISPMDSIDGIDLYEVSMTQFSQQLHSQLNPTTVWGYNGTYPGPTFEVQRGNPIKVNWVNDLADGNGSPLPHLLPLDTTVHGAEPQLPEARTVVHLHGAVVEPESDGFPEHWFSADPTAPANSLGGPAGNSAVYTYGNQQPSTTLWYHDHGLGITRLNVYAGLAGFYLIRDADEASLNLPSGEFEVPMVIQDRSFYADGQLFYPRGPGDLVDPGGADPLAGLPEEFPSDASVVPHFFGDTNLVNGKVWPVMDVEPRKYRLRMLNGSNSRFYDLQLDAGAAGTLTFHQIGSDGGLLEARSDRDQVLMAPAERADVIVDFSSLGAGDEVILRNLGPDGPFEGPTAGHTPADPNSTGQVMKFHVVEPNNPDTSSLPQTLVSVPRIPEEEAVVTRQLSLVEEVDEFGRPKLLLDGAKWTDPLTELPVRGTTEIWEITNSTADSHPIHLHLVQFQVLDRVHRQLGDIPLENYELGWKDTFMVNRRETVRVIAKFDDFDGLYVWHCHILEHEDHEMMRPFKVVPGPELVVEQGVTLLLTDPHTTPAGNTLTVDGTLNTPQLDMGGLLRGMGVVEADVINRGTVSPGGDAIGTLTIGVQGNFSQTSAGRLELDLGGGGHDQVSIVGDAALDGAMEVSALGDFAPAAGDAFNMLHTSGTITGQFAGVANVAPVGTFGGTELFIVYKPQDVLLMAPLLGDMDSDGDVDFDDIDDFVTALNDPVGYENMYYVPPEFMGDTDGDGDQDFDDIDDFVTILSSPTAMGRQAVPEPSTFVLAAAALLVLVACKRLRTSSSRNAVSTAASPSPRQPQPTKWLSWGHASLETTRIMKGLFQFVALSVASAVVLAPVESAGTLITLAPMQDNTLYEKEDGSLSNGAGAYLFAGTINKDSENLRRALIAFDIAGNVPADSVIQSATLTLEMSRTQVGPMTVNLHRVTSDWGEGISNASGNEGDGTSAEMDDATWIHTFYPDSFWTDPGGDFDATVSASRSVDSEGPYTWGSTGQMVSDVQGWLDTPASNFGWLLKGPEGMQSAKRFNSREHNQASKRPVLAIEFMSGGPEIFNWIGTGSGGSFHDDGNWDTNQAPSSSTDIVNLVNTELTDQIATLSSSVAVDDLTINGDTNSMTLSIGQGLAANVGDLTIGSLGGLAVELATGASGQLNASGAATLAGTLALSTPGSTPAPTDSFQFLTYASRTGTFETVTGDEIEPGRSFSLHYNSSRALAIAGEWTASGEELSGDVSVPQELLVTDDWAWNGTLVKRGAGELVLDLDGGFNAGSGATLAIVDGTVRLTGVDQTLSLDALTFGELGQLSGDTSLAGQYGWYGSVVTIPEPTSILLALIAWAGWLACYRVAGKP